MSYRTQSVQPFDRSDYGGLVTLSTYALLADELTIKTRVDTTTSVVLDVNDVMVFSSNAAATGVALPPAETVPGRMYIIKDTDVTGSKGITLNPDGAELIDGGASLLFGAATIRASRTIISDGTEWFVIGAYL